MIPGAITAALGGWFWRFQLHPMRPGDNSRRLEHVGVGTGQEVEN
jgi:hypothetical protein